jgi:hypothetical protein
MHDDSTTFHPKAEDLTGQSFGGWTVQRYAGSGGESFWKCLCVCGHMRDVRRSELLRLASSSPTCNGHWTSRRQSKTHGLSQAPEYHVWWNMLSRCENPKAQEYPRYGTRGITVCAAWHDFMAFYTDMGPRPSARHSIDRYPDPNGHYGPENCRWATPAEQNRNMRKTILLTHNGVTLCMKDWAAAAGMPYATLDYRLKHGWLLEDALTTPPTPRAFRRRPRSPRGA